MPAFDSRDKWLILLSSANCEDTISDRVFTEMTERSADWEKRHRLFDTYSKNLSMVKRHPKVHLEPEVDDIFVCPLCFNYFTRDEVIDKENQDVLVTLEHVPPRALGGRERTLTCSSCNSWAGHELDSHLIHKLELLAFIQGLPGASIDTKISVNNNINLTATAKFTEDRLLQILYDKDRSDPREFEKFLQIGEAGPQTISLTSKGKRGRVHKARRPECSLLRSAYLWAFSVFGYGFLINGGLPAIRGQIKNPAEEVLPNWGISQRFDYPDESLGINIIVTPKELLSFLVVFDVRTPLTVLRYGIMLPGPTAPGTQIYRALSDSSTESVPITYKHIPSDERFLTDPDFCFASHEIWKQWRTTE